MQVTVKLFATFRVGRFVSDSRDYAPGTPISHVIQELGIPEPEIGMIMLNGRHAEPADALHQGANLALFPLLGGG